MKYCIEEVNQHIPKLFYSSTCSKKEFSSDSEAIAYAARMAAATKRTTKVYRFYEEARPQKYELIKIIGGSEK